MKNKIRLELEVGRHEYRVVLFYTDKRAKWHTQVVFRHGNLPRTQRMLTELGQEYNMQEKAPNVWSK